MHWRARPWLIEFHPLFRSLIVFPDYNHVITSYSIHYTKLYEASQETVTLAAGDTIPVKPMFLYGFGDYRFLIRNFYPSASFSAVKSQNQTNEDAVFIEISDGIKKQTVPVFGHSAMIPDTVKIPLGTGTLKLAYGSMPRNNFV